VVRHDLSCVGGRVQCDDPQNRRPPGKEITNASYARHAAPTVDSFEIHELIMNGDQPEDVADRLELQELVHRYAQAVDRADGAAVADLFVTDGVLIMYGERGSEDPTSVRRGKHEIARAINSLADRYLATAHLIGNHVPLVHGDQATAETRCEAHHVQANSEGARDTILFLRYYDRCVRQANGWRFFRRELRVDFSAEIPLGHSPG
jgi:ketosteroid isomerase-like protein